MTALGIERQVEAQHAATASDLSRKPDAALTAISAELAMLATSATTPNSAPNPKKADAGENVSEPDVNKPKQALRKTTPGPKMT